MNIIFQAGIEKIETRADRTMKLIMGTPEMSAEQIAKLYQFFQRESYCLLSYSKPNKEQVEVVKDNAPEGDIKGKTPSQRLRNVIFVYWQQQASKQSFDDFYERAMEKLINTVKDKLE